MEDEPTNFFDRFKPGKRRRSKESRNTQFELDDQSTEDEIDPQYGADTLDKELSVGISPHNSRSTSAPEIRTIRQSRGNTASAGTSNAPLPGLPPKEKMKSKRTTKDPIGLKAIAIPPTPRVDIVFIHGLGGGSLRTWSWNHDPRKLWLRWLADESDLATARIWTYGYLAGIDGTSNALSIHDFAKDLLFKLKYESPPGEPIGNLPIIFITHSMGGLIAKKAYLSGKQDKDYEDIIAQVKAVIFFSTPHRGGNGAESLSLLLKVVGMSKEYIKELIANSTFLHSINDDFANACNDLRLFSFYETMKTFTPVGYQCIVDKDSGILNLQNETNKPVAADHSSICKFERRDDPGYKDIRNVLIRLISPYLSEVLRKRSLDISSDMKDIANLLSIDSEVLDENLDRLQDTVKAGTCNWIVKQSWFSSWLHYDDEDPHILWLSGPPAVGKSVLTAYITGLIRETWGSEFCQYHAFNFADKSTRSASYLFRSFAYQIACGLPTLRTELQRNRDQVGAMFSNMSASAIWERIFRGTVFNNIVGVGLCWVIDGLDEAEQESISIIFQCLQTLSLSSKIKILLVSRDTADITMRVAQLQIKTTTHRLSPTDTCDDIQYYVQDAVGSMIPQGVALRQRIIDKVLRKASGNFLWVTLAAKELEQSWHRSSNIEHALGGLPGEMTPRYDRMMEKIEEHSGSTKRMAVVLLIWTTFSFRPLQLNELKPAISDEFPDLTSLEDTIKHICGDFVQLRGTKITLLHDTARHYLITQHPDETAEMHPRKAHEYIAIVCLKYLSSSKHRSWRRILNEAEMSRFNTSSFESHDMQGYYPFLSYAAKFWAYHLSLANPSSQKLLEAVVQFLDINSLTWINTLAFFGDLKSFIKTAQYLKAFIKNRDEVLAQTPPHYLDTDGSKSLRIWVVDLIRLVGKFGSNLIQNPSSIYRLVPPFCPSNSMLRKIPGQSTFSVIGVSMTDWDDCHARLSVGAEGSGRKVVATSEVILALVPGGHGLVIWHAETCEELRRLKHDEYVTEVAVNRKGDLVCTAGAKSIKIWELLTGRLLACIGKHSDDRILAVGFGIEDSLVLVGYQDHLIVCQNWRTNTLRYAFHAVQKDDTNVHNGLRVVSFSPDGTKLIVGSRNRPVDLWNLATQSRAARCVTKAEVSNAEDDIFLQPEVVQWHPSSGNIYILYHNTTLIDWNPAYEEKSEHQLGAKGMVASPCGNYLLTYEADGSVKIFGLPDYSRTHQHDFRPIYHLVHPEHVRDVAFAPDGRRFYDLRDSICSVWEPEVLVPPDRSDEKDDQSSSHGNVRVFDAQKMASLSILAPVTAIACAPNDLGFCCGRDDGSISVHEMTTGTKVRSLPGHAVDMAIIGLTWSCSGRWIASADDSGRVLVRKVHMPSDPSQKMTVYKASNFRIKSDGVNQLLFSSNDRYLLISTFSADRIWDVTEKRICHVREYTTPRRIKWIEHPSDPSRLVSVDAGQVQIFNWNDFVDLTPGDGLRFARTDSHSITGKRKIASPISDSLETLNLMRESTSMAPETLEVKSLTQINDKRSLVLEILPHEGYEYERLKHRRIEFLQTTDLSPSPASGNLGLQLSALEFTREVLKLVGSYQNHLVFFNQQHWLCTWEVGTAVKSHKKHLFLPKDWVSTETLRLTALSDYGTLLCPRNGEVAIIKGGIQF